jgi:hypothetical protein
LKKKIRTQETTITQQSPARGPRNLTVITTTTITITGISNLQPDGHHASHRQPPPEGSPLPAKANTTTNNQPTTFTHTPIVTSYKEPPPPPPSCNWQNNKSVCESTIINFTII